MRAGCAAGIHRKRKRLLILKVTPNVIGAGVDAQHKAPLVEQVGWDDAAAGVSALGACGISIEQVCVIGIEAGKNGLPARGHEIIAHAQTSNLV